MAVKLPAHEEVIEKKKKKKWTAPPFTIGQLRKAIPPHCFQRSLPKSLAYVAMDLSMLGALFFLATKMEGFFQALEMEYLKYLAWPLYWFCAGAVGTGVWILAHECGHQAFSDYKKVNHLVGWILHSFLLVPYFSWKITHSKHHKKCGHLYQDQVYVPEIRQPGAPKPTGWDYDDNGESPPIVHTLKVIRMLLFGWPTYLTLNYSGQPRDLGNSHFNPESSVFEKEHKTQVLLSDLGLLVVVAALGWCCWNFGAMNVVKYYGVPYLIVNAYLVCITFLQHTHEDLPHFKDPEWSFLIGALMTCDYSYGILDVFFHHIGDTHVAHHLFSTMPFYHAQEATAILKEILGEYYHFENKSIIRALYDSQSKCRFVVDEGDILYYTK